MIKLKIDKFAYGGEGLGFQDGKVCFVAGALPGETVEIELTEQKKNFSRGRLLKILEKSSSRIDPPCPYLENCGGCQYQHVDYAEELRWKEIQVREYLARNLKISEDLVRPIVGASQPYHYRNSLTVHRTAGDKTGFFSEDNENITLVENCLLADERLVPAFQTKWSGAREKMTCRLSAEGEFINEEADKIFPVLVGKQLIYTTPQSFFQNNLEITARIGETLANWVKKIAPETFIDLYSGVGTFSVLAATGVKKVVCVEDNRHSQPALKMNLEHLGIPYEILNGSVEKKFANYYQKQKPEKSFVFVDPPRMGMVDTVVSFLSRQNAMEGLAYLSCHLGTLTRDLGIILKGGIFKVEEVIPFDMFPRTKHIEIAVLLKKS